jgi:uncharacterized protein YbjT (DUF2867 family)
MFAVAGVTGRTGRAVAKELLSRHEKVRVIVRDAARAQAFQSQGAEVAVADLADAESLGRALDGTEGAYLLLPIRFSVPNLAEYQRQVARCFARAVRAVGVPHVVFLSSVGAELSGGTGPIAGLSLVERLLGDLPTTAATFIRAAYFMENVASALHTIDRGFVPSFFAPTARVDMIATRDIGTFAAQLLAARAPNGTRVVNLGGPAVTMREVLEAFASALGRPLSLREIPSPAVAHTFINSGMPPAIAPLFAEMIDGFVSGQIRWEARHEHVQGVTKIGDVVRELLEGRRTPNAPTYVHV